MPDGYKIANEIRLDKDNLNVKVSCLKGYTSGGADPWAIPCEKAGEPYSVFDGKSGLFGLGDASKGACRGKKKGGLG